MAEPVTTCQICARVIKSASGKIAHHGYKRPSEGWQTASCMGARYRPYEVACDALPPAIKAVIAHIERMQSVLADWRASPPASIRCTRELRDRRTAVKYPLEWHALKPAGFDASAELPDEKHQARWDSNPSPRSNYGLRECDIINYAHMYAGRLGEFARDIEASKQTLDYFRKRLADWKAPAQAPAEVA